jgi:hypothetical protein
VDLLGKAAMGSHYFPEKKRKPDVAKVTVSRAPTFYISESKGVDSKQKVK